MPVKNIENAVDARAVCRFRDTAAKPSANHPGTLSLRHAFSNGSSAEQDEGFREKLSLLWRFAATS
jgi:hypothetical protein